MDTELLIRGSGAVINNPTEDNAFYNLIFGGETGLVPFNWKQYLQPRELQYWLPICVSASRTKCAEAKAKKDGIDINFSQLELAGGSGTTKYGNGLQEVSEYFRTVGIGLESDLPLTQDLIRDGWPDYDKLMALYKTLPASLHRYLGGNHSWVYGKDAMKQALAFSPLQPAVPVGENWDKEEVVQPPKKIVAYHAVVNYFIDEADRYLIQDSIGKEFKILSADYPIIGTKSFRDLTADWKDKNAVLFASIRMVFGPQWSPAPVFYKRGLIARGIFGAVRIKDKPTVYTIGPGGSPVRNPAEYQKLFGTLGQGGIVGEISVEQARRLGIQV